MVSEILARACRGGVAVEPAFRLADDGLRAELDTGRPAIVRGYVPAGDAGAARAAVEDVRRNLGHLQPFGLRPIGELETRLLHEEDWAEAWKSHFPVLHVGRRLVIRPTWRRHRRAPGEVVLTLDPGQAFGTGLHPTTRLCLAGLERWADEGVLAGARLLDVGTGSGILAVAAGLLGAREVLGVDTDPLAVEATRGNAARNRLGQLVEARQQTLPIDGGAAYDFVVANLVADLLIDLASELAAATAPAGRLLVGGVFVDRGEQVERALSGAGLVGRGRLQEADWLALEFERR